MDPKCVHSCAGLCNALDAAERCEQQAIALYRQYAVECDYPDVRELLEDLIRDREKGLAIVREKREILSAKFEITHKINDNFA
jgi:rubrerythrin